MSEKAREEERPDNMADEVAGDTYYIDNDLTVMGHLTACHKCGRKMVVELPLIGVPHHLGVTVTCGECLVMTDEFRKEHPKIASKVEDWLHAGRENKQG